MWLSHPGNPTEVVGPGQILHRNAGPCWHPLHVEGERSREVRGPRLVVNVDSALDMTPIEWSGARNYFATARYPHEPEDISARRTPPVKANPSTTSPDKENCVLHHSINMPFDPGQDVVLVAIYEMGVRSDVFVGESRVPLGDKRATTTTPWPLTCQGVRTGTLTLNVKVPLLHAYAQDGASHRPTPCDMLASTIEEPAGPGHVWRREPIVPERLSPREPVVAGHRVVASEACQQACAALPSGASPFAITPLSGPQAPPTTPPMPMTPPHGFPISQEPPRSIYEKISPMAIPPGTSARLPAPQWPQPPSDMRPQPTYFDGQLSLTAEAFPHSCLGAPAVPLRESGFVHEPMAHGGQAPMYLGGRAAKGSSRRIPVPVEVVPPHMSDLTFMPMASAKAIVSFPCPYRGDAPWSCQVVETAPV
mmetsp:Transcript_43695/g.103138  ORF Transcript_43695/g.103138 Transcript_43695/m.103138 type:complete len:421 (-) Transcript_43695:2-1264(-)